MRSPSYLHLLALSLWVIVATTLVARVGNINLFLAFSGGMLIVSSLFSPLLRRWLRLPEPGAGFTNPRYLRSAKVTDRLSRLAMTLIGLGLVVQGIGGWLLGNDWLTLLVGIIALCAGIVIGVTILARLIS